MKFFILFLFLGFSLTSCATTPSDQGTKKESELVCEPSGCSGQVCSEKGKGVITTCLMLPQYECVKKSRCEVLSNGKCGWAPTPDYLACLKRYQPAQHR